jgi:UDP-N-acetylmuramate dehydrogenase
MSKPHPVFAFEEGKLLSQLSTFGIGGPARFFAQVQEKEELQSLLRYCLAEQLPFFILGKGSNSLFDDKGFDGIVILNKITFCDWDGPCVHAGAGYSFSLLGTQTAKKGWRGLEFASGIPGSVGGAVYMNAGAGAAETCGALVEVTFANERGELEILERSQMEFSYRFSSFQRRRGAIVSAKFQLHPEKSARETQLAMIDYRTRTQPYGEPSVGCVFRNPHPYSAGTLIQQCGLKGRRVGGAEVSLLHANFIVNTGGATAKDVLTLAHLVKEIVREKTGIEMEMEMRYISYLREDDVSR